jgi:hypothetical protein
VALAEHHSIQIAGIVITEPGTCFTDVLLSVLCFILYKRAHKNFSRHHFINAWKFFFLFMSLSTCIGVFVHGFSTYIPTTVYHYAWMAMNICAAIASYFTMRAVTKFIVKNTRQRKRLNFINLLILVGFCLATIFFNLFEIVKVYIAIAVTINFIAHLIGHLKFDETSKYIMLGMFISFFTIFIHSTKIIFNAWIDYKSISHLIMIMSILLVYRGVYLRNYQLVSQTGK